MAREAFLRGLDERRDKWASPGLDHALDEAVIAARRRWQAFDVDAEQLAAYLAARAPATPPTDGPWFPHADELALASAVVAGSAAALAAFEQHYMGGVTAIAARFRLAPDEVDELMQGLRVTLLVGTEGRAPQLADYSGRGPLASWLRVAAARAAMRLKRARAATSDGSAALERLASSAATPELGYVREESRALFREALRASLRSLDPQEQNVLRQHHLDGLTIDELGALYRVHRTTAAYWLTRAHEHLFRALRRLVSAQTKMSKSECDSLFAHAQSQAAISLRDLFSG
jgi:RNA polymerase sigma-70 factor (ECF subfamily)